MKIGKQNIIGAAIAFVAMVVLVFGPIFEAGGQDVSLFPAIKEAPAFGIQFLLWPLLAIIAHLFGKMRGLASWLMLLPFVLVLAGWLINSHVIGPGISMWIYLALTIVLIIYTIYIKKANKA